MTNLREHIKTLLTGRSNRWLAFLMASSAALLVYTSFFQRNFFSKRYLVFTILIFAAAFFGAAALNRLVIGRFFSESRRSERRLCLCSALILALLLLVNFEPVPLYLLEKKQTITIQPAAEQGGEIGPVELVSVRNPLGYIPFEQLGLAGARDDGTGNLIVPAGTSLTWQGYFNDLLEIGFAPTSGARSVHIEVDGVGYDLNLQEKVNGEDILFRQENQAPVLSLLPFILSFLLLAVYLLIVLLSLLSVYPIRSKGAASGRKYYWYGLPLLVSCVFTLLVFWPGMMSNDSLGQWGQAVNMDITDWHPIFHTYLISLLIKLWYSPALIAILQVLALCLVFTWGMNVLQAHGVPTSVLWVIAFLFAIFPPNLLLPITLWKDIGYSIALLALFIVVLQIALSSGEWLSGKRSWLALGITGFCVAIFRQNGFIVAVLTLVLLAIPYRKYKRVLLLGLLVTLVGWLGVRGLLNWKFNTSGEHESQTNLVLLPHIAAHVAAGTPLDDTEESYLNALMPLSDWDYDCCYIGNISYNAAFDRQTFLNDFSRNLGITIDLFRKDPLVDFRHQACASEIIWKFNDNRCSFKSLHAFNDTRAGEESWILPNDFGLKEDSLIPAAIPVLMKYFQSFDLFTGYPVFLVKPAFYLWLSLIMIAAAGLKRRNLLLLLIPVLSQAATLAAIIFAPSYRYQYGMCLIGFLSLALYFLPDKER